MGRDEKLSLIRWLQHAQKDTHFEDCFRDLVLHPERFGRVQQGDKTIPFTRLKDFDRIYPVLERLNSCDDLIKIAQEAGLNTQYENPVSSPRHSATWEALLEMERPVLKHTSLWVQLGGEIRTATEKHADDRLLTAAFEKYTRIHKKLLASGDGRVNKTDLMFLGAHLHFALEAHPDSHAVRAACDMFDGLLDTPKKQEHHR